MDGEWRLMTIGDLAAVRSDRVMPSPRSDEPYVGLEHIEAGSGRLIGVGRSGNTVSLKTPFQAGDILYGKLRPSLRKVLRATICGLASTEILAVVPKLASDGPFVKHILHSDQVLSWALQGAEGTKMPRTSWQRLSGFEFLCPPPAERAAIAETLDAIDDAIEKSEAVIAATEGVRKALLQELLTRGVPGWHSDWKTVPDIGKIPACWEAVRLGEVAKFTSGSLKRTTELHDRAAQFPVPVYGGNGISGYTDQPLLDTRAVVIGRVGQKCGSVHTTTGASWITDNALYSRWIRPGTDVEFLGLVLAAAGLNNIRNRNDLPLLTQAIVHQVPMALPCEQEQQKIVAIIDAAERQGAAERESLWQLRSLKTAVGNAVLSGRVRVPATEVSHA